MLELKGLRFFPLLTLTELDGHRSIRRRDIPVIRFHTDDPARLALTRAIYVVSVDGLPVYVGKTARARGDTGLAGRWLFKSVRNPHIYHHAALRNAPALMNRGSVVKVYASSDCELSEQRSPWVQSWFSINTIESALIDALDPLLKWNLT